MLLILIQLLMLQGIMFLLRWQLAKCAMIGSNNCVRRGGGPVGKRDMKNKTPPSGAKSQSLVLRLNTRLFFRQLGIFLCMDLLLVLLALMGQLMWA